MQEENTLKVNVSNTDSRTPLLLKICKNYQAATLL